jgi:hypothetical protein
VKEDRQEEKQDPKDLLDHKEHRVIQVLKDFEVQLDFVGRQV